MLPYNPISTINDSYPIIRDLESTLLSPHVRWINDNFDDNNTSAKFVNPNPWYHSGITRHGSSMWQLTFRLGRHLKYTRWNCTKSFWGGITTVAILNVNPVGAGDWSFSMPNRAVGGVISLDLPSNPSLPFHLHARCHPTRGSNELQDDVSSFLNVGSLNHEVVVPFLPRANPGPQHTYQDLGQCLCWQLSHYGSICITTAGEGNQTLFTCIR